MPDHVVMGPSYRERLGGDALVVRVPTAHPAGARSDQQQHE